MENGKIVNTLKVLSNAEEVATRAIKGATIGSYTATRETLHDLESKGKGSFKYMALPFIAGGILYGSMDTFCMDYLNTTICIGSIRSIDLLKVPALLFKYNNLYRFNIPL